MKSKSMSYQDMAQQLEQILAEVNSGDVPLELLDEKLKLAKTLLQQCQEKLRSIEKILKASAEDNA
jgi:exodeoxyribonuclease VII small subunit